MITHAQITQVTGLFKNADSEFASRLSGRQPRSANYVTLIAESHFNLITLSTWSASLPTSRLPAENCAAVTDSSVLIGSIQCAVAGVAANVVSDKCIA